MKIKSIIYFLAMVAYGAILFLLVDILNADLVIKVIAGLGFLFLLWIFLRSLFEKPKAINIKTKDYSDLGQKLVDCLGGLDNIVSVDKCATRVLLSVKDSSLTQVDEIRQLGITGVLRPSNQKVQLIVKDLVVPVYDGIKDVISRG